MKTMFKTFAGRTILAAVFFALAATGCSDDSGTSSTNEYSIESSDSAFIGSSGENATADEDIDSSASDSEETSANGDTDSLTSETEPVPDETEPSGDTDQPSENETTSPTSSAELTPLQEYEQARAFIDDGWRDECLKLANDYRATEEVAPLTLADDEKQLCAITQAAADMADNAPHGHFKDCGEWAQNSGPNFSTSWKSNATAAVQYYIKMMWEDEKALVTSGQRDPNKDEDYSYIGHYLNMRKASYTKVACGIAISADGKTGWFNMNFYY